MSDLIEFEVWMEGHSATGEHSTARFMGTYPATSFLDACNKAMTANNMYDANWDPVKLTYWGCRCYPTEKQARRTFG